MSGSGQRRWGWHQLRSGWADRVVAAAQLRGHDLVLDLGAGAGALTRPLAGVAGRILAVELHPGRSRALREEMAGEPGVSVHTGDMLAMTLPGRRFRVVANPPYAIGAQLVRRLTSRSSAMVRADLVLPRWMVRRFVNSPPRGFTAAAGLHVPASAFRPPPPSDSAVLVLRRTRPARSTRPGRRRR